MPFDWTLSHLFHSVWRVFLFAICGAFTNRPWYDCDLLFDEHGATLSLWTWQGCACTNR